MGIPGLWLTHFAFCLGENLWFNTALGKKLHFLSFPPHWEKAWSMKQKQTLYLSQVFCRTHSSNSDIPKINCHGNIHAGIHPDCRLCLFPRKQTLRQNTYTSLLLSSGFFSSFLIPLREWKTNKTQVLTRILSAPEDSWDSSSPTKGSVHSPQLKLEAGQTAANNTKPSDRHIFSHPIYNNNIH